MSSGQTADPRGRWEELVDREALGEELDPAEREFVADYEREHPECAHERQLWRGAIDALEERAEGRPPAGLGERALVQFREAREPTAAAAAHRGSARGRLRVWPLVVGLAAAAALGIWAVSGANKGTTKLHAEDEGSTPPTPDDGGRADSPPPPSPAPPVSPVESGARLSVLDGEPGELELGARVMPGELLRLPEGRGCLVWEAPRAVVCFEGNLSLAGELARGERRVHLEGGGRLVAALDPLEPGQRFVVETVLGSVSAVGTVFAVELDEGRGWVSVLEGRVELRDPDGRELAAGSRSALRGELPSGEPAPTELSSAVAELASLAKLWRAKDRVGDPSPLDPESGAAPDEGDELEDRRPGKEPTIPSASALARDAQRNRMARDYEETARLYGLLLEHYPDSAEAANVPVRLGDLLASTGDHQGALEAYELYLDRGGVLAPEAEYGAIRALRELGREAEEAEAIEAYLEARPDDHRRGELESRLDELR